MQFYFASFWLDLEKRQLLHSHQPVTLTRKALETLGVLVSNAGRVVTREDLKRLVWADAVVEEATIAQNIFTLRKTLGRYEGGQNLIETVPGVGYRFTAQARAYPPEADAAGATPSRHTAISRFPARLLGLALLATILAVAIAGGIWSRHAGRRVSHVQSLAVLPFANLTGDPQQEYVADGIADALLTDVAQVPGLRVISGRSATRYQKNETTAKIGRDLQVDAVVEGAVLKNGDRLSVDVRLVQVSDDRAVWTARFDFSPHDLLELDSNISRSLLPQLQPPGTIATAPRTYPAAVSVEAYDEYLKGRFFWNRRTQEGLTKAIACFTHAIALDPKYAHAHAGLADSYALLGSLPNAAIPRSQAMSQAKAAALEALKLDESLAEAHTSLAFVKMHYEWDWAASETEFKRALQLNPNYATAHQWYAIWLLAQQKIVAALEEQHRAQQADPLSAIIKTDTAQFLIAIGRYDEAAAEIQRALEIDPDFLLAHIYMGEVHIAKQQYAAAIREFQQDLARDPENVWTLAQLGRAYGLAGQRDKAEEFLRHLTRIAKDRDELAMEMVEIYAALKEKDLAFLWLERAYKIRSGSLILLNAVPEYRILRDDSRFAELTQRVGLPHI
jgi:TolB-like protein/DNA-binding winged helix-turn-helix (wHTH) protein/Tfp pilus assembly protein PilF